MAPFLQIPPASSSGAAAGSSPPPPPPPLTIADWRALHLAGAGAGGLEALRTLVGAERKANAATRAWVSLAGPRQLEEQWRRLEAQRRDAEALPLFGVPFAVKDNIDVAGFATTAACPAFAAAPAASDAPVVARLKAAGAVVVGKTNMDQFATGLVGTRSPHGAVPNAFDPSRVSGGSSSGSGLVVARGAVPFSLGSDTAGSGRVPAGLNNVVGLKPTRGALSARGLLPACRTLDCISVFALTVDDAQAVLAVAEGYDAQDSYSRPRPCAPSPASAATPVFGAVSLDGRPPSLAVCSKPEWYGRDDHAPAYEAALERARCLGWRLTPVDFSQLFAVAQLLYEGPWVAERYAALKTFIEDASPDDMDPVVRGIVTKAHRFSAADAFASEYARQDLARQIAIALASFDGLLVPTTPTFPTIQQVAADPVRENSLLGTYTNFVNFLDWSAISIPAGFRPDGLPFGVTLISSAWQEPKLLELSRQWLSGAPRRLGATMTFREADCATAADGGLLFTSLAVVGAHLTGFPLNKDLVSRGARLEMATRTSQSYRLYELSPGKPGTKKPGLERVAPPACGRKIAVEVWKLPAHALASFMATIPAPLAIGSVELEDGRWVRGFVCEPIGLRGAKDITRFGGWKGYMDHSQAHALCNGVCMTGPGPSCSSLKGMARVLVANRGEIAARIVRTLRAMGIEAVTIYADSDAGTPHVRDADTSLRLEGDGVAAYLDGPQIIRLAKSARADAIIPGYGFLAEGADFARAVEAAGLVWIGPTPKQMTDLGLKHRAREIAVASGVPVVPGSAGLATSLADARREAERLGFPLMLKSTAGGGGIGLRCCRGPGDLADAFDAVQRLAAANFGEAGVFLERFIENARHIEVQVLGDGKGRVVALGERDCSLQRRHQKVVEECPAFAVPAEVRARMRASAVRLAAAVAYRSVGTVEFIYDVDSQDYYMLEVNTRLQVEHPVTEAVTGLDLVECMLQVARGDCAELFGGAGTDAVAQRGASIEVRLYAESPVEGFRPCAGRITALAFPSSLRVDSWVNVGTQVSTRYDPLLAKLIATGHDRCDALRRLAAGLEATRIEGVQTNLEYLRQIVSWSLFEAGSYTTSSLDSFQFQDASVQVVEPGPMTTIQDYPGRVGFWSVGIPPSGPMDHLSFRLANRMVDNEADVAAIECTFRGPTLKFHCDTVVAIAGATAPVAVDGEPQSPTQAFAVRAGQVLSVGTVENGYRLYIAVAGGVQVPKVMGSRATFELGNLGGKDGSKLHAGDVVPLGTGQSRRPRSSEHNLPCCPAIPIPRQPDACWTIGVVPGPHGAPDYFTEDGLATLFGGEWRVHHNSNRLGIRLTGPRPRWARQSGGEAGLHPSNIHDSPYSIGSVSFTGDEAVVLTCDGPSLGGFVVFCVVASSEMWKLGQARPGDRIRLRAMDTERASRLDRDLSASIRDVRELPRLEDYLLPSDGLGAGLGSPVVGAIRCDGGEEVVARQAGDRAMMLEFGGHEDFDLGQSFKIQAFCQSQADAAIEGIDEVTPGVRTVHVSYAGGLSPETVLGRLARRITSYAVPRRMPSRTIHLPLAFDDSVSRAAVERYAASIRSEAPWLPSNVAFLEELNGLDDISGLLYDATFLVLGLGDVFLGSPCAVPLDPRHRLFGTKYNPSRSFTPRRSVGIGGQYMCIYATDSPGGYQLVGRTVDIWDAKLVCTGDGEAASGKGAANAWMFRPLDRIRFYAMSESELDAVPASQLVRVTEGELDLDEYEAWLESNGDSVAATAARRKECIASAPFLAELGQPYRPKAANGGGPANGAAHLALGLGGGEVVKATMPGKCYKLLVKENSTVKKGELLMCIESSKMEIEIRSPVGGRCAGVAAREGGLVDAGQTLVTIEPACGE